MSKAFVIAALAVSVAVSACGGGTRGPEFGRAEADAVRKTAADLAAAFNAKDVDAIMALFGPDAVFMPPNAPLVRGKDAIRNYFKDILAKGATGLRLDVADAGGGGVIGFQSGAYALTYETPGQPPFRDRGKYLFVLRNLNAKWVLDQTIWSSDLPPRLP
jgi:ketosteroid isomerase-like protein